MSGVFTIIINRIGDCFFIFSVVLLVSFSCDSSFRRTSLPLPFVSAIFLFLTFITKRAIFPFSPWLPLAIAAPTPISALVHSSTLVTAGLFLFLRFSYVLSFAASVLTILFTLSIFTSFYAGLAAYYEKDLKKVIALSTLSHLGFIGMAFSLGLFSLAYFHLLSHALFKSLLFMAIGDIITVIRHSQESRVLSSGALVSPFSCLIMLVSLLRLFGLPNLTGYFSKDLILEAFHYSNLSIFFLVILFCNVASTYLYTFLLFGYSFKSSLFSPFILVHSTSLFHSALLLILGFFSIVFGYFFISLTSSHLLFVVVPLELKLLPSFLLVVLLFRLLFALRVHVKTTPIVEFYGTRMLFLGVVLTSISSTAYVTVFSFFLKSIELGGLSTLSILLPQTISQKLAFFFFLQVLTHPMKSILFSSFLLVFY